MSSGQREKFENPVIEWVDSRLPIFTMLNKEYGVFPTPRNFTYLWSFGGIAMTMLLIMIVTGITLAMHYDPNTANAFNSVERIMRDVNHGWLIRYLHMNGASFFFIAVFIHMFRGLYYGSYKKPRELLWILGVVIFLLMMATAFMGYVLPWGQMSFWGATVITNLFSAIPLVGDSIVTLLWGGFSVDNPTLNRFFALHYLMPFVIFGVVFIHVWALHVTGSNNPLGIEPKGPQDTLPFHPYYTMKDGFAVVAFLAVYALFTFFMPDSLGHPDNYIEANPLVTPPHIVPEWYFLPFYAILRAITFDLNIYLAGAGAIAGYLVYQYCWKAVPDNFARKHVVNLLVVAAIIGAPGFILGFLKEVEFLKGVIQYIPFAGVALMPAKLGGVLAMFGSIAMLILLPFLDRHPVRSAIFRPWFKKAVITLAIVFVILGVCGAKPAEGLWVPLAQVMSLYYFGFFLVLIPLFNNKEPVWKLPNSISEAVLQSRHHVITLLAVAGLLVAFIPSNAMAQEDAADVATVEEVAPAAENVVIEVAEESHASTDSGDHHAAPELPKVDWSFDGPFGSYDRAALQRGFQVYKQVCAACHSMDRVAYRNLAALGYSEGQIKAIAAEYSFVDGPDDEGEMFDRPGRPSDHFKAPYANQNQAKASNNGALPPDLSLIVKARAGGANYVYGILTGYEDAPMGEDLASGQYWNKYMAGHKIAMAPPLADGVIAYDNADTPQTTEQYAKDVATFLTWAAQPEMEVRKQTGTKVLIYLLVFAGLLYAVKRKIWAKIH
jgi:ubiquinol-cytochrome c reductase cytochrome b/c1 subunit